MCDPAMEGISPFLDQAKLDTDPIYEVKIYRLEEEEREGEPLVSEDASDVAIHKSAKNNARFKISYPKEEAVEDIALDLISPPRSSISVPTKEVSVKSDYFEINTSSIKKRKWQPRKLGGDSVESLTCKECGNTFPSLKSKYGHMRCHSNRLQKKMLHEAPTSTPSSPPHSSLEQLPMRSGKRCKSLGLSAADIIAARTLVRMSRDFSYLITENNNNDVEDRDEIINGFDANSDGTMDTNNQSPVPAKRIKEENFVPIRKSDSTSQGKKYRCGICNKSFSSYQALGGHTANHNKKKIIEEATILKESNGADQTRAEEWVDSGAMHKMASTEHKCQVCKLTFPSGQALGGHKRRHWMGLNNRNIAPSLSASPSESGETTNLGPADFNLNETLADEE